MREEDLTIFDYRREKEIKNTEAVLKERLNGKFEKGTVRTKTAGYIDFSIYRPDKRTVLIVKSWRIWLDVW